MEIEGTVDNIVFQSNDSAYIVLRLTGDTKEKITVTGYFPAPLIGEDIRVTGKWIVHKRFGRQFSAQGYIRVLPTTEKGIEKFLSSGFIKGLGPALAKRIVQAFGKDTLQILENEPERLHSVSGIGDKKLEQIITAFSQEHQLRDITLLLESHGISGRYATKIISAYGDDSQYIIENEPYRMIRDIEGIGFKIADHIAISLGAEQDADDRIANGIHYILDIIGQEGHTCVPEDHLIEKAAKLLYVDASLVSENLGEQIRYEQLATAYYQGTTFIYPYRFYEAEVSVATRLRELKKMKPMRSSLHVQTFLTRWQDSHQIKLGSEQIEAAAQAVSSGVLVITGGPGTGKTTVVQSIIDAVGQETENIHLCAPTGRAAKRLTEASGREALTIHRLLVPNGMKNNIQQFEFNENNQLSADVVIVDEMSMIDLSLMYHLLQALPDHCRLVMVGDADQLPAVGAGAVLYDIIRSEAIPVIRLSEVFRQAEEGSIVLNAHRINHGLLPIIKSDGDFQFHEIENEAETAQYITEVYRKELEKSDNNLFDVQVLSPMHRQVCGVENLNSLLQQTINPLMTGKPELIDGTVVYRVGDKILQKKNNYMKGVFNGDIGIIWAIQNNVVMVRFMEQDVRYERPELDEITLAYAMTVHKSQGSEYKTIIMALVNSHYIMLQRNLLYTAVTRAKKNVILVGTKKALQYAAQNARKTKRFTLLAERLREEELC